MNTKKSILIFLFALATTFATNAQSVAINNDGSTADPSAILDLKSTNQGVLVPRLTESQRTTISSPATGLMVYQTDGTAGFYFYNGTAWTSLNGTTGAAGPQGPAGATGATGPAGAQGTTGANGQGVPTGGTANQVLAKVDGTNYNTQWVTPASGGISLPSQTGNGGKVLTTNGTNVSWTNRNGETFTVINDATSYTSQTTPFVPPAFTDDISTQTFFINCLTPTNQDFFFEMPDPANVPDGKRIIIKKVTTVPGSTQTIGNPGGTGQIYLRYTNWTKDKQLIDNLGPSVGTGLLSGNYHIAVFFNQSSSYTTNRRPSLEFIKISFPKVMEPTKTLHNWAFLGGQYFQ